MDTVFVQGMIATVLSFAVFVGTPWLVLSMVLGARMAYLVIASVFFGVMLILSGMWFLNGLGPKGLDTTWFAVGVGDSLSQVEGFGGTYDVSDYPQGDWEVPAEGRRLADLRPRQNPCLSIFSETFLGKSKGEPCNAEDTLKESLNAGPVMTTLVSAAISPIPGKRDDVKEEVHGAVSIPTGTKFTVVDIRVREAVVDRKESLIAMGRAVPSDSLVVETLGTGIEEAEVSKFLIKVGDVVKKGQPVLEGDAEGTLVTVRASSDGRVIGSLGLRTGDKVKAGVPLATVDLSGQAGQPPPAEVSAVRVRGSVRTPAFFYLVGSLLLFAIHMGALARTEKQRSAVAQPA